MRSWVDVDELEAVDDDAERPARRWRLPALANLPFRRHSTPDNSPIAALRLSRRSTDWLNEVDDSRQRAAMIRPFLPALVSGERPSLGAHDLVHDYQTLYDLAGLNGRQGLIHSTGYEIHVQLFETPEVALGTVLVMHGYLEHSGLYSPLYREILDQGFNVLTFDLAGHGLSSGLATRIDSFADYQQILNDVAAWGQSLDLAQPWLGMGQSTGGAIWVDHILSQRAQRLDPLVQRVFLFSPLIRPARSAWWHNAAGLAIMSKVKDTVPRLFRRNNSNPEYLRFVRLEDPLQPHTMSLTWIVALAQWMPYIESLPPTRFPVWLAQGARDATVDWKFNIDFIREHFRLQAFLLLEEGSHQLINERMDIRTPLTALIPAFLHAS